MFQEQLDDFQVLRGNGASHRVILGPLADIIASQQYDKAVESEPHRDLERRGFACQRYLEPEAGLVVSGNHHGTTVYSDRGADLPLTSWGFNPPSPPENLRGSKYRPFSQ
jgi:hypothetical protein